MSFTQSDLFAQDTVERNRMPEEQRSKIRSRLEATLVRLEASAVFPWHDPLDAVHEENRFHRDAEMLGDEGGLLWSRFDKVMDRLHQTHPLSGHSIADSAKRG